VISGFCCEVNEIWLLLLDWRLEMGPKRCTETSVTKYYVSCVTYQNSVDLNVVCLADRHLNVKYVEDPNRLSQRKTALAILGK
jgi:hypothetical protein